MIEPTDEMVQLAVKKFLHAPGVTIREIDAAMREALAAVLAIVERDWNMQPNPNRELCGRCSHLKAIHTARGCHWNEGARNCICVGVT